MKRLILFTYLALSVFMSRTWTVNACFKTDDKIQLIYDFLMKHESGEFKEYAELIKNENNINAKNGDGKNALHQGICSIILIS
jgi:ribosome-binding ATPase YchF (GTP1/OBG family)